MVTTPHIRFFCFVRSLLLLFRLASVCALVRFPNRGHWISLSLYKYINTSVVLHGIRWVLRFGKYRKTNTLEEKKKKNDVTLTQKCKNHKICVHTFTFTVLLLLLFSIAVHVQLFHFVWSLFLCCHARNIIDVPLTHSISSSHVAQLVCDVQPQHWTERKCQHAKKHSFQLKIHPTAI